MDPHQVISASVHGDLLNEGQDPANQPYQTDQRDQTVYEKPVPTATEKSQAGDVNVDAVIPELDRVGGVELGPQQTNTSINTYPEGGLRAWLVVVGAWFSMVSAMGLMNTVAVFQAYIVKHQLSHYSEGTVGWIFSLYTFLAFFGGVYIGPIFDKYGPVLLVSLGVLFTTGGLIGMSFCNELWQFILSYGILCGLGTSLIFTPCIASVGHWFKARRGLATGLACSAGGFGGIIFPLMLTDLFDRIGFGWSIRVLALVCFVCGVPGILLLRSRLPPVQNASAHPDFRIFKQIPFLLTTVAIFLIEFSMFIPLAYISSYAQYEGFGQTFAYHLLPILNAGSVVGRSLPGYYADVIGPFNVYMLSAVLSLISCLVVWLPLGHSTAGIVIFTLLFGFASGTSIAIAPVCVGRLCKTQTYGRYYATCYTVVSFACLIGIPIAGAVLEAEGGSYSGLIIFTGVVYVASAVVTMLAKFWSLGWGGWAANY